jgi:hypothetical protein
MVRKDASQAAPQLRTSDPAKTNQKLGEKRQTRAFIKLALYSALMFCLPFAVFLANAYTYLDRECV